MSPKDADRMANSVDPRGEVWSGSTLFAHSYLSKNLGSLQYDLHKQKKKKKKNH